MSRNADERRLRVLLGAIERHPGQRVGFIARLLGWPHEVVNRGLVALGDHGVLLSEDERGGLWPVEDQDQARG
jgi:DNA-binding IclR family transcriptional regulator